MISCHRGEGQQGSRNGLGGVESRREERHLHVGSNHSLHISAPQTKESNRAFQEETPKPTPKLKNKANSSRNKTNKNALTRTRIKLLPKAKEVVSEVKA